MKNVQLINYTNKTYLYPARTLRSVDFPAPDGPSIAVNSPDLNWPLTPLNINFEPMTQPDKI